MALGNVSDRSISDMVAHELREAIQQGEFEPGKRLVERTLASSLGVSHIPVREALARLSDEGLIERTPRRGARVAALSAIELQEISSLRTLLEQFVSRRVQSSWTPADEAKVRKIVDSMVAASKRGDVDTMFALDRRFHEVLWEMADHKLLMTITSQLRGRINGFVRAANSALAPSDLVAHAMTHYDLIDAIASGNPDEANAAMAQHIDIAAQRIQARIESSAVRK